MRWLDEGEQAAWRSFLLMQAHLTAELARDLARHSPLSYQDYAVLVVLSDQPSGQLRMFQLARELDWEKSRLGHQLTRMEGRGLVMKSKCDEDRRGALVGIRTKGREQLAAAAPSHVAAVRRLFVDRLTPAQLQELAVMAKIVLKAIAESGTAC